MGGIGATIGVFSLLGGLLFLAGIALVVMSVSQGRPARPGVMLAILGIIAFLVFGVISQGIIVVQPQQAGVVFNVLSGEVEDNPLLSGTHIIIPMVQEVTLYPISQQEYTMSGSSTEGARAGDDAVLARSVDGQEVNLEMTIIYRINAQKVKQIHIDWPQGYVDTFIRPTIRSIARDVVATYQAEQIYGIDRTAMQTAIQSRLEDVFDQNGFTLSNMLLRSVSFSPQFTEAIEEKQIEEQKLQRARTEAERFETEAKGRANAAIEAAKGEGQAILIRAAAEAEALRLVSQQIGANPNLIPYIYVQNLSDNINLALIPANSPFLFDINSFQAMGDDFVPPAVPEPAAITTPDS